MGRPRSAACLGPLRLASLGVVLVLAGCGSSSPTAPTPTPTPAPSPSPTPRPNDITLLDADPPQGSTVSLSQRTEASLRLRLNVAEPGGLYLRVFLVEQPPIPGTDCEVSLVQGLFGPGQGIAATATLDLAGLASACPLPQAMALDLLLDDGVNTLVLEEVRSFYTLAR